MTTLHKTTRARTSLVVLYSQNYAARICRHYHESSDCFEYPKKSLLKSSHTHTKKYLPNSPTRKNPGIKNFKPKKSFNYPRNLKSGVPPLGSYYHNLELNGKLTKGKKHSTHKQSITGAGISHFSGKR